MANEKDPLDKVVVIKEVAEAVSAEMKVKLDAMKQETQSAIDKAADDARKGVMTLDAFETFKKEQIEVLNAAVQKLEDVTKEQGNRIVTFEGKSAAGEKQTFEQFIKKTLTKEVLEGLKNGTGPNKVMEIPLSAIKAAGVTSIGNSIQATTNAPTSPWYPGIGGPELEFFNIVRNPNYIVGQVDLGRTGNKRLAWLNETGEDGVPTEVLEGQPKPLISNTFKVEFSEALKMAAYYEITEEAWEDLDNFATIIRRMLQERVLRGWDDAIQTALFSVASAYSMPGLANSIPFANYWDSLLAMMTQVRTSNFIPNAIGINPQTYTKMVTDKTSVGDYLIPPFKEEILGMLTQANKVTVDNAVVGDLSQYKVDIYKEFVIRVGWINDNFINNKFCLLGEIRYHRYISDNRKAAIVKGNLGNIRANIDGGSGS